MRKNAKWLPEIVEFLKANVRGKTKAELAVMLNEKFGTDFTKTAVCTKCVELRINGGLRARKQNYNERPIGSEQVKKGYVRVKVAMPDVWRFKHHVVWEQSHGETLKAGERVIFLDGDNRNFAPENLERITAAEQGVLNNQFGGGIKGDAEATRMCLAAARLMIVRIEAARNGGELGTSGSTRADVARRKREKARNDEAFRLRRNRLALESRKRHMQNPAYAEAYRAKAREQYRKRQERKRQEVK